MNLSSPKIKPNSSTGGLSDTQSFGWLASLMQTTDSLFPSGGYAHSYGLEELVALGTVQSKEDLEGFLIEQILPSLEKLELPYLRFCIDAVDAKDYSQLLRLNEEISAWKLTHEIREAGKSQGAQLLRMTLNLYPCPFSKKFHEMLQKEEEECQQITATAVIRSAQGVPLTSAMIGWIYQSISNFCSASIKLLRLGELACQKIIHRCINKERVQGILDRSLRVNHESAGFFNPVLDLASARHELAFSRLFIS
jgi:urease accessory protein